MNASNNFPIIERYFYPMDSSLHPEKTDDFLRIWAKYKLLPTQIKDLITDHQTASRIKDICLTFSLTMNQSAGIARSVRYYYLDNLLIEDLPQIIINESGLPQEKAWEIAAAISKNILFDNYLEKSRLAELIDMTLTDAIKNYPEIGEQLIGSSHIRIKSFPDGVRPSIHNWLTDYTMQLGYDYHDTLVRGRYLFQSPNTKMLTPEERVRLSFVLKAFDEKTKIKVNPKTKQLVFPLIEKPTQPERRTIPPVSLPKPPPPQPQQPPIQNSQIVNLNPNPTNRPASQPRPIATPRPTLPPPVRMTPPTAPTAPTRPTPPTPPITRIAAPVPLPPQTDQDERPDIALTEMGRRPIVTRTQPPKSIPNNAYPAPTRLEPSSLPAHPSITPGARRMKNEERSMPQEIRRPIPAPRNSDRPTPDREERFHISAATHITPPVPTRPSLPPHIATEQRISPAPITRTLPVPPTPQPQPRTERPKTHQNIPPSPAPIKFSSPQTLPYEKQSTQAPRTAPIFAPLHIHPVNKKEDPPAKPELPKNVVNLKEL